MSTRRTTNARLRKPAAAERNWDVPINANMDALDGMSAIGRLLVTTAEQPGASPTVRVTAGPFCRADGTVFQYPGAESFAVPPSATTCLWLTESGQLSSSASFPIGPHVRLARVVAGQAAVTSVVDERVCVRTAGTSGGGGVSSSGGFEPARTSLDVSSSAGVPAFRVDAEAAAVGFFGAPPAAQSPRVGPLLDASAGTPGDSIEPVGALPIDHNFASLTAKVNALIAALQRHGLMGS